MLYVVYDNNSIVLQTGYKPDAKEYARHRAKIVGSFVTLSTYEFVENEVIADDD